LNIRACPKGTRSVHTWFIGWRVILGASQGGRLGTPSSAENLLKVLAAELAQISDPSMA
jgi:hypothetical protein